MGIGSDRSSGDCEHRGSKESIGKLNHSGFGYIDNSKKVHGSSGRHTHSGPSGARTKIEALNLEADNKSPFLFLAVPLGANLQFSVVNTGVLSPGLTPAILVVAGM